MFIPNSQFNLQPFNLQPSTFQHSSPPAPFGRHRLAEGDARGGVWEQLLQFVFVIPH